MTISHMLETGMLFEDQGIWSIGREGEVKFGRRHFMDLLSAFTTEPLFTVKHGQLELGRVHQLTFATRDDRPAVLLLAGRAWVVVHVDWKSRVAFVKPSEDLGRSRWLGSGAALGYELCQSVARVPSGEDVADFASRRAAQQLEEYRASFTWFDPDKTAIVQDPRGRWAWWTFAGLNANAPLAQALREAGAPVGSADNYRIALDDRIPVETVRALRELPLGRIESPVNDKALEGLKFSECLPVTRQPR
jgi:ATP-dependent helicase Lhr and Lhr-like helicase